MAGIFKANDIVRAAVEAEKKGEDFYNCLAGRVKNDKVQQLFKDLAQEEVKHREIFQALLDRLEPVDVPAYSDSDEYQAYFDALVNSHMLFSCGWGEFLLDQVANEREALKLAMTFERDSLLFFKEMKDFVPKGEQQHVQQCIDEERKHLMRLKKLLPEDESPGI